MPNDDPKSSSLAKHGVLHPHPEQVTDELFESAFFDARDLLQVKYEMLRRVRVDGRTVATAAAECGLSRPTFYEARDAYERGGIAGLLPAKKGPRRAHKLSEDVMAFVDERRLSEHGITADELAALILERFGRRVHPRSIDRAVSRRTKKAD